MSDLRSLWSSRLLWICLRRCFLATRMQASWNLGLRRFSGQQNPSVIALLLAWSPCVHSSGSTPPRRELRSTQS
eukprot:12899093-Alexandrium_andersonii.AAC.1